MVCWESYQSFLIRVVFLDLRFVGEIWFYWDFVDLLNERSDWKRGDQLKGRNIGGKLDIWWC